MFDFDNDGAAIVGDKYRVTITQDEMVGSPRDWDNVSTFVCNGHRRYRLGDEDAESTARGAVRASRDYRATWEDGDSYGDGDTFKLRGERGPALDLRDPVDLWTAVQLCSDIVAQPLFLYDHSGLSISTGGFACPWDSGQIGFAFVTLATIRRESTHKRMTAAARQWARSAIDAECGTYDSFLSGEVWRANVDTLDGEHVDSCGGFYGRDAVESFIRDVTSC